VLSLCGAKNKIVVNVLSEHSAGGLREVYDSTTVSSAEDLTATLNSYISGICCCEPGSQTEQNPEQQVEVRSQ
jgi:hypothetical protein